MRGEREKEKRRMVGCPKRDILTELRCENVWLNISAVLRKNIIFTSAGCKIGRSNKKTSSRLLVFLSLNRCPSFVKGIHSSFGTYMRVRGRGGGPLCPDSIRPFPNGDIPIGECIEGNIKSCWDKDPRMGIWALQKDLWEEHSSGNHWKPKWGWIPWE